MTEDSKRIADLEKELGRAYRCIRGFWTATKKGEPPDRTMLAYHSPTIAAACRLGPMPQPISAASEAIEEYAEQRRKRSNLEAEVAHLIVEHLNEDMTNALEVARIIVRRGDIRLCVPTLIR